MWRLSMLEKTAKSRTLTDVRKACLVQRNIISKCLLHRSSGVNLLEQLEVNAQWTGLDFQKPKLTPVPWTLLVLAQGDINASTWWEWERVDRIMFGPPCPPHRVLLANAVMVLIPGGKSTRLLRPFDKIRGRRPSDVFTFMSHLLPDVQHVTRP